MLSLCSNVLYVLNNNIIWFRDENKKRFQNSGLVNFIRVYKFIPNGIYVVRTRRKRMVTESKTVKKVITKAPAKKLAKKAPAKKAPVKSKPVKKPAKK